MPDWLETYEAPDWHSISEDRGHARDAASKLLGARSWTETLKVPKPDWLIPDLLQRKALHMFSSDKGCYKTWLGLSLLAAGVYGIPVLGQEPAKRFSTVYVAADSPDWDIGEQLRKLLAAYELKPTPGDSFILPFGIQFTNEKHVAILTDLISTHDIDHLAIDVKGYTQGNLDENSDAEQMLYYRVMKHFRDKLGVAVTIFHHFAKTTGKPRGAGTTEQASEHCYNLIKTRAGVRLHREKIRGDELWSERLFTLGHANNGRLLVPVEAAIQTEPASAPFQPETDPPISRPLKKDLILSAIGASKRTRDQLLMVAVTAGKDKKWLDNRLQYLRRKGLLNSDGDGNWTLTGAEA